MTTPKPGAEGDPSRSAAAWAQDQILDLVQNGSLQAGQKLPPERELAGRLGVSRASVREAISALVTLGVLEARHGAGVFVTLLDPVRLLSSFAPVLAIIATQRAADLTRLHTQVEAASAARAAARAIPTELGPLRQTLVELRLADIEPETRHAEDPFRRTIWHLSDERFHRAIAHLADDPVAEGMTALLRHTREQLDGGRQTRDLGAHERLVQAIAGREPELAGSIARQLVQQEFVVVPPPGTAAGTGTGTGAGEQAPAEWHAVRTAHAFTAPRTATTDLSAVVARPDAPDWFRDAKLGLIVHWGIYSIPGWAPLEREERGGRLGEDERHARPQHPFAEWYQASAALNGSRTAEYHQRTYGGADYRNFRPAFDRALHDWQPETWAEQFATAGARYVVQVAKHHDGFLLWPSRVRHPSRSDWRASRDVVGELAAAVREHGMRYGLFYSSGVDWSFATAPPAELADVLTSSPPGVDYARYVEAQWRELIEDYQPDGLWNDTGYPAVGDARRLFQDYYAAVPDGVVSDRFRLPDLDPSSMSDAVTAGLPTGRPWESIRPIGRSFGWNRQETAQDVLSGSELVLLLMDVVSTNRNLLLGVSPDDHGVLSDPQATSLADLGGWLAVNGAAVYDTAPWTVPRSTTSDGRTVYLTRGADALYATIEGEVTGEVAIDGVHLDARTDVTALHTGVTLTHGPSSRGSTVTVPERMPGAGAATVLRISPPPDA